jgi:hypothetical protein
VGSPVTVTRIALLCHPGAVAVLALAERDLVEYALWYPGSPDGVGDLHRGRVIAAVPAMAGCFVAIAGAEGFLPNTEGGAGLREGEAVLVRVTRAALGGKGPRLSARHCRAAPLNGPIARIAAGATPPERFAARYPGVPIETDDAGYAARLRGLGVRVNRDLEATLPLDDIAALAEPGIILPDGPRITVTPTPALVAIDVDLAARSAERGLRNPSQLAANRALIPALARQIRLRNLSGAILVDLAGLPIKQRQKLAPDLAAALALDPLRPRFLGFTALGLAELVRTRVHPPLHELLAGPLAAGLAALRAVLRENQPRLAAAPAVVAALEQDGIALEDISRHMAAPLQLRSDPCLAPNGWSLKA